MGIFDAIGGSGREPYIEGAVHCPRCGLNLHPKIEVCPACDTNMRAPAAQPYQQGYGQAYVQPQAPGQYGGAAIAPDMSQVPPAPSEEPGAPQGSPAAFQAPQAPAADVIGIIQHDVVIGSAVAFRHGERVRIEAESPDPERPEYRFVVYSAALNKRFRLSDLDVLF